MSTQLQQDLAEAIVENSKKPRASRKNKKELLVSMGYATSTAESIPNKIIEAKGVKDALAQYGLTEELITTALVEDIKGKPKKRERELALGAEILGMKKQNEGNKTLILMISGESAQRYGLSPTRHAEGNSN